MGAGQAPTSGEQIFSSDDESSFGTDCINLSGGSRSNVSKPKKVYCPILKWAYTRHHNFQGMGIKQQGPKNFKWAKYSCQLPCRRRCGGRRRFACSDCGATLLLAPCSLFLPFMSAVVKVLTTSLWFSVYCPSLLKCQVRAMQFTYCAIVQTHSPEFVSKS